MRHPARQVPSALHLVLLAAAGTLASCSGSDATSAPGNTGGRDAGVSDGASGAGGGSGSGGAQGGTAGNGAAANGGTVGNGGSGAQGGTAGSGGAAANGGTGGNGGAAADGGAGGGMDAGSGGSGGVDASVGAGGADSGVASDAAATDASTLGATLLDGGRLVTHVGPEGGVIRGPYGARLIIPSGALASDVDITIARDSSGAPAFPPSDVGAAGGAFELTPHGTAFALPATLRIPFDPTRVPGDAVPVFYEAELGGSFAEIPTTVEGGELVAHLTSLSWVIPAYASARSRHVYVPTAGGISGYRIVPSGALTAATSTALAGQEPTAVVVHPSGRFAYVTNGGTATQNGVAPNSVASYRIDVVTGAISGPTGSVVVSAAVGAARPVAPVIHPSGKFLYVAGNGDVSVFAITGTTGALTGPSSTADSGGASSTAVAFTPSGLFAFVTYRWLVGTPTGNTFHSQVKTFSVDPATGQLSGPTSGVAAGDTPWAMAVDPLGKHAYVAALGSDEVRAYDVNAGTGTLTYTTSAAVLSKPAALSMDSRGRFLYVGKQQPYYNVNLLSFGIDAATGALTSAGSVLTANGAPGGVAVVAEPQGDLVYTGDNGQLSAFRVDATTGSVTAAGKVTGLQLPAIAGVGVPISFGASGVSPTWRSGCTFGCFTTGSGGTSGSGGASGAGGSTGSGGTTGGFLSVTTGPWGGFVVSSPAGISCGDPLQGSLCESEYPRSTNVQLCVTPRSDGTAYDIVWSGSCSGTTPCVGVSMATDKYCHVELSPRMP